MDTLVSLENVGRSFGQKPIFKGVNLQVNRGDAVAIKGPSGMGKTTLLRLVGTLDFPTEGTVYVLDRDTSQQTKNQLAELRWNTIGFNFQEPMMIPGITVLENVLLPCYPRNSKQELKHFTDHGVELLTRFGLKDRLTYKSHQLSLGQKKRVDLARAMINNPPILIVDEPTTNLDDESSEIIQTSIKEYLESGGTLFLTTHQNKKLLDIANRTLDIQDYQRY